MYNSDTDFIFPQRVIPALRGVRGEEWMRLVDDLAARKTTPCELHAFTLMMVRMSGCVNCDSDSFRAMRGCTACARQTVKRYRGTDSDLIEQLRQVQREVETYLKKQAA